MMKPSDHFQIGLRIHLLGTPEIRLDGALVDGLSTKSQALLFFLAATGQAQMRSTLATFLWGDLPENRARANLRKAIQRLRQQLGEHLHIDRRAVALVDANCWVDIRAFRDAASTSTEHPDQATLERAIDWYRGDLLAGFHVRSAVDFDEWMAAERARLRETLVQCLDTLAARYAERNELQLAINAVRRIVDIEPWREEAHRRLMLLAAENGDTSAALAHYAICREMLRRELDVEPGPETEALRARLQSGAFQRSLNGETTTPGTPGEGRFEHQSQPAPTTEYQLVGRDAEWQKLADHWTALEHPLFLCIGGESGIGKTRLAEELLCTVARTGRPFALTRCYALEGQLSYGPIVDWLRTPALKANLAALESNWLAEISRLLPELSYEFPDLPLTQPLTEDWQRKRVFDALARAFTINPSPLLLVIDDLQWCDRESLTWIHFLVESVDRPLLVVGTVRTDEIRDGHPLREVQQQLGHQGKYVEIPLKPLDAEDVATLAGQVADQLRLNGDVEEIIEETAGNPLFVIESVRVTQGKPATIISGITQDSDLDLGRNEVSLPPKMYDVIRSRLAQLSRQAQMLAQLGATVGRQFDVALLAAAGQTDEEAVYQPLDDLWQRRLIRQVDAIRFDFSHDRVRDVAYAEIPTVKRALFHRKIAMALERLYADGLEPYYGELAAHYEYAGLFEQAIAYCQKTADAARQLFSHEKSLSYRQRALELLGRVPESTQYRQLEIALLIDIARDQASLYGLGNPISKETVLRAYNLASELETPRLRIETAADLAGQHRLQGNWRASQQFAQEALLLAEEIGDEHRVARAKTSIAFIHIHLGNFETSRELFDESHQSVIGNSQNPTHDQHSRSMRYAHCLWLLGFPSQARHHGAEALRSAVRIRPVYFNLHAMTLAFCRDLSGVDELMVEQTAISRKQGDQFFLRCAQMYEGWLLAHRGDTVGGIELVRTSTDEHRRLGNFIYDVFWRSLLVEAYLLQPDPELALDEIEQLLELAEQTGNRYWNAHLLTLKGASLAMMHMPDEAVEACFRQAIDTARRQKGRSLELRASIALARFWQQQGKVEPAYRLLAPIYRWFTEGFDTADLQEARALLAALDPDAVRAAL